MRNISLGSRGLEECPQVMNIGAIREQEGSDERPDIPEEFEAPYEDSE